MTTMEIGKKLVELCAAGKNHDAMEALYGENIVSVEAGGPPGMALEANGKAAVITKSAKWAEAHTIHSAKAEGPWPHGDRFIVRFTYDITQKATGNRIKMDEAALFTVANGKIVREEFFYGM